MMTTMRGGRDEEREAAYTAAFQELFPRAVRLAARILGDRSAAEDVAAEAMTRAYSAWDRIGSAPAYRTGWTLRVATNLAIDVVRRRERASDLSGLSDDLDGGPFGVDGPGGDVRTSSPTSPRTWFCGSPSSRGCGSCRAGSGRRSRFGTWPG
jgi:DNA-directed RNA polymerase specialized sigma24 family protein